MGRRIKFEREERGLSLAALGEICGLSASELSRVERGEYGTARPGGRTSRGPGLASMLRLAEALGVDFTWMIYGIGDKVRRTSSRPSA